MPHPVHFTIKYIVATRRGTGSLRFVPIIVFSQLAYEISFRSVNNYLRSAVALLKGLLRYVLLRFNRSLALFDEFLMTRFEDYLRRGGSCVCLVLIGFVRALKCRHK